MAFGRKAAVGTPLDREELEELLDRLDEALDKVKSVIWDLDKSTASAARVMEDLNKAVAKSEAAGRRRLSRPNG